MAASTTAHEAEVEDLLARRQDLAAYDRLVRLEAEGVTSPGLAQRKARALAKMGFPERALEVLDRLERLGIADAETLGNQGSAYKQMALAAAAPEERLRLLRLAREKYAGPWESAGSHWTGINVATISLLLGERDDALATAARVRAACERRSAGADSEADRYWLSATIGEAHLVEGRLSEALHAFAQAAALVGADLERPRTTRANARLVLSALPDAGRAREAWAAVDAALPMPPVAHACGHMVDAPGRATPRFPASRAAEVKQAIADWIRRTGVRVGYASAASGTDLLFHEAILEAGGESHVMLPFPEREFLEASVAFAGREWVERYRRVLGSATACSVASTQAFRAQSASYAYANLYLEGLARVRARELGADVARVAHWNGMPGDGPGGTSGMVAWWAEHRCAFDWLDASTQRVRSGRADAPATPRLFERAEILTALFADVVGFSRFTEEQLTLFVERFLPALADAAGRDRERLQEVETWGDGFFFLVEGAAAAGRLALRIRDAARVFTAGPWGRALPIELRIGLHTGPVRFADDPLTGRRRSYGAHLTHAARIEPITPKGLVYASEAFAVLAATEDDETLACRCVGSVPWAKEYGLLPTYRVDWRGGAAPVEGP